MEPSCPVPQRYPFAGSDNSLVEIHVVDLVFGKLTRMDLGPDQDIYLARADWNLDGALDVFCANGFVTGDIPVDT